MDILLSIFLDFLYIVFSNWLLFILYGIGFAFSQKPKTVMRWYIAGTAIQGFSLFGMMNLIKRNQGGIPTYLQVLSAASSLFICIAFYFIMRRRAKRLSSPATPVVHNQIQETGMSGLAEDHESGEALREELHELKRANTSSAGEQGTVTDSVRQAEPPADPPVPQHRKEALKKQGYKIATIVFSAICTILAIFVFLLGYSVNSSSEKYDRLMEQVELLTERNSELQETVENLKAQNEKAQEEIAELVEERTNREKNLGLQNEKGLVKISDIEAERAAFEEKLGGVYNMEKKMFANIRKIGFIVDGSMYYHSFICDVYYSATKYEAHNIVYCEYYGYSRCPECW